MENNSGIEDMGLEQGVVTALMSPVQVQENIGGLLMLGHTTQRNLSKLSDLMQTGIEKTDALEKKVNELCDEFGGAAHGLRERLEALERNAADSSQTLDALDRAVENNTNPKLNLINSQPLLRVILGLFSCVLNTSSPYMVGLPFTFEKSDGDVFNIWAISLHLLCNVYKRFNPKHAFTQKHAEEALKFIPTFQPSARWERDMMIHFPVERGSYLPGTMMYFEFAPLYEFMQLVPTTTLEAVEGPVYWKTSSKEDALVRQPTSVKRMIWGRAIFEEMLELPGFQAWREFLTGDEDCAVTHFNNCGILEDEAITTFDELKADHAANGPAEELKPKRIRKPKRSVSSSEEEEKPKKRGPRVKHARGGKRGGKEPRVVLAATRAAQLEWRAKCASVVAKAADDSLSE